MPFFRLKVKELRNVLQLFGTDNDLVDTLGELKDAIGEWHDWTELGNIADEILDHSPGCEVRTRIRDEVRLRFDKAMTLAHRVRKEYFETHSKNKRAQILPQPVLQASATLAA